MGVTCRAAPPQDVPSCARRRHPGMNVCAILSASPPSRPFSCDGTPGSPGACSSFPNPGRILLMSSVHLSGGRDRRFVNTRWGVVVSAANLSCAEFRRCGRRSSTHAPKWGFMGGRLPTSPKFAQRVDGTHPGEPVFVEHPGRGWHLGRGTPRRAEPRRGRA